MTTQDLKTLNVTELRKVLKDIIVWDKSLVQSSPRNVIIEAIERYEQPSSPKHGLFMQNLRLYNQK